MPTEPLDDLGEPLPLSTVLLFFGAALTGAAGAIWLLPAWTPALSGTHLQAPWFLSRASGLMAYLLVWASMVFGLLLGTRWAKTWPGPPAAFALHQHTSLLGLAFAAFHGLVLLGDRHLSPSLAALAVPFALPGKLRWSAGVGQLAFFVALAVTASFWVRQRLGPRLWKAIHFSSFGLFALALAHGVWAGSDASRPWLRGLYFATAGGVLFLTLARGLAQLNSARRKTVPACSR